MSAIVEKIKLFADEYEGMDFLEKNQELLEANKKLLVEEEKENLALWYSREGSAKLFCQFVTVMDMKFEKKVALQHVINLSECHKGMANFLVIQEMIYNAIELVYSRIEDDKADFLEEILINSIKYSHIYIIQKLLEQNVSTAYINANYESITSIIKDMQDVQLKDYLSYYLLHHEIKEDCREYFVDNGAEIYEPKYEEKVNDYFENEGIQRCKELLKSYNHENLLDNASSTAELKQFIEREYNWDDGVEIPYYIMHHKNCDIQLKKELFELGAGDCLDRTVHSIKGKDPWERFIIELDDMINEDNR